MTESLDLDEDVRPVLEQLEDKIIIGLSERSQFKSNPEIYEEGRFDVPGYEGSQLDILLEEVEESLNMFGRYEDPKRRPFTEDLPEPAVPRPEFGNPVDETGINVNSRIQEMYEEFVDKVCEPGSNRQNFEEAAVRDIKCLQDISKRVHFGRYVAEAKFQQNPDLYKMLIQEGDESGIEYALTDEEVEETILDRVADKAENHDLDPEVIRELYRDYIIPMTIDVELDYFMQKQ